VLCLFKLVVAVWGGDFFRRTPHLSGWGRQLIHAQEILLVADSFIPHFAENNSSRYLDDLIGGRFESSRRKELGFTYLEDEYGMTVSLSLPILHRTPCISQAVPLKRSIPIIR
jgi:hypothetical protein